METPRSSLTSDPGTYVLGLTRKAPCRCHVGALGVHTFPPGLYLYVGSAWGPGGLAARVNRHLRGGSSRHWHIDHLRAYARPIAVWWAVNSSVECVWAQHLLGRRDAQVIVVGFGSSDCTCETHLIYLGVQMPGRVGLPGARGPWMV